MRTYNLQRFNIDKQSLKRKLSNVEDTQENEKLNELLNKRTSEYNLEQIGELCKILISTKKEKDIQLAMIIKDEIVSCQEDEKVEKLKIEIIKIVNNKDHINNEDEIIAKLSEDYGFAESRVQNYLTLEQEKRIQQYLNNEGLKI